MRMKAFFMIISLALLACKEETGAIVTEAPVIGWKETFAAAEGANRWLLKGKPGTRPAVFSIATDPNTGVSYLSMEANSASASLVTRVSGIDITKTPILRWRWRVTSLPEGADGRIRTRDDQAIGIYVGTGSIINNRSVSYRWDTLTPVGAEGSATYGLGAVKVKWLTLRNGKDASEGLWFTEERNILEDFNASWGYYPKDIYLSVSCNSQYTGSRAAARLEWIEFTSIPESA